ncbi:MAG: hypothetical protein IJW22_00320, partial [Clostridia bacterium]|nr:hypothetical protein [Clostridia bacterium]
MAVTGTMNTTFLTNQKLSEAQLKTILSLGSEEEPVLFAVVGEISQRAHYGTVVLLATRSQIFTYDFASEAVSRRYDFDEIDDIITKRMYGNGMLRVKLKDGGICDLFRFTFAVAALCDAVRYYVLNIRDGESPDEALAMMESVYDKMLSVCPKCGRTLSAPGVPCIHCMKKGRLLKKLGSYLLPEWPILVISIIMSVITTSLALTPPLLTKSLVDDILPNKDLYALGVIVVMLVGIYIVRYGLSGVRGYMLRISGNKIVANIRRDVYEKAQHLPMRFYDKTSTGAVINRISGDTATIQAFMLRITQEVVVQFFKLIGIVIVMLVLDPRLTLFSLIPVPLVVIGSRIFRKKIAPFYRRIWRRSSAVTSVLTDTIPGIRVIKSFTNEKNATDRFTSCVEEWRVTDTKAGKILNAYPAIVNCLIACGSVVIWALGGSMVINGAQNGSAGTLTVGLLVSFISYASMFYEPVN